MHSRNEGVNRADRLAGSRLLSAPRRGTVWHSEGADQHYYEGVGQITLELHLVHCLSRVSHGLGVMRWHQASCGLDKMSPDLRNSDG